MHCTLSAVFTNGMLFTNFCVLQKELEHKGNYYNRKTWLKDKHVNQK